MISPIGTLKQVEGIHTTSGIREGWFYPLHITMDDPNSTMQLNLYYHKPGLRPITDGGAIVNGDGDVYLFEIKDDYQQWQELIMCKQWSNVEKKMYTIRILLDQLVCEGKT